MEWRNGRWEDEGWKYDGDSMGLNYYKYEHWCDWLSHIRHDPYRRHHFVPAAVSLAGVYMLPAKPVLPWAGKAGFLPI